MRALPLLTGVLTIALLGGVGGVLVSEGAWLIGSLALGFAVFRLVVLVIQTTRWVQSRADERDEPAALDGDSDAR